MRFIFRSLPSKFKHVKIVNILSIFFRFKKRKSIFEAQKNKDYEFKKSVF